MITNPGKFQVIMLSKDATNVTHYTQIEKLR